MSDLLTALHKHDLPPYWDGRAVVWEDWEYAPSGVFICPPPKDEVCDGCGEPTKERGFPCWSTANGLRADSPRLTHADYEVEEAARARLPFLLKGKFARHWWIELHVTRCHHCQLDQVWDTTTDEWFDLDHTDYGDDGSSPPVAPSPTAPSLPSRDDSIRRARQALTATRTEETR